MVLPVGGTAVGWAYTITSCLVFWPVLIGVVVVF